jgi:hypothetical protein
MVLRADSKLVCGTACACAPPQAVAASPRCALGTSRSSTHPLSAPPLRVVLEERREDKFGVTVGWQVRGQFRSPISVIQMLPVISP